MQNEKGKKRMKTVKHRVKKAELFILRFAICNLHFDF